MVFLIRHGEDDNTRLGGWSDAGLEGNVLLVTPGGVIDVILCVEKGIPYTNRQVTHKVAYAELITV